MSLIGGFGFQSFVKHEVIAQGLNLFYFVQNINFIFKNSKLKNEGKKQAEHLFFSKNYS